MTSERWLRVLIFVICAAWISVGLVGHEPWRQDEAYTFGLVYHILKSGDLIVPHLGASRLLRPPIFFISRSPQSCFPFSSNRVPLGRCSHRAGRGLVGFAGARPNLQQCFYSFAPALLPLSSRSRPIPARSTPCRSWPPSLSWQSRPPISSAHDGSRGLRDSASCCLAVAPRCCGPRGWPRSSAYLAR
jgi:hypothetical protein